jgi:hypothetical protein
MCPSLEEHARRQVAGWRYISRYREALTFTGVAAPHLQLRRELGDQPYVPPGTGHRPWAAHHIVPWNHAAVRRVHALFFKCLIHPNERANGFYLRGPGLRRDTRAYQSLQQTHPQLASRTYHGDTFRPVYVQNVLTYFNEFLDDEETAGCPTDTGVLRDRLSDIRQRLSDGTFDVGQPEN